MMSFCDRMETHLCTSLKVEIDEPSSYKKALALTMKEKWLEAMRE